MQKDTKKKEKSFGLNFEEINFKTNWATLVAIAGLLVFSVTLYVENGEKDKKIAVLESNFKYLNNHIIRQDSIIERNDEYLTELIQKSSAFEETDMLVFYKDIYFENRFRRIDGKSYLEFIPDKIDFYKKTSPTNGIVTAQPISIPHPMSSADTSPMFTISPDTTSNN